MTRSEHNDGKWLTVRFEPIMRHEDSHAWFVVRTCPCHFNERVTIALPSRADARRARRAIIDFADPGQPAGRVAPSDEVSGQ